MWFIEIRKMSGMKSYFGYELEELFYPKEKLKPEWGFSSHYEAEKNLPQINIILSEYNMAVAEVTIIELT